MSTAFVAAMIVSLVGAASCVAPGGPERAGPLTAASPTGGPRDGEPSPGADPSPHPTSAASADVLRVFCGEGVTRPSDRHVEASEGGVHLRIDGRSDGGLFLTLRGREEGMIDTWTIGARWGILPIPPGPVYVKCFAEDERVSNDPESSFTRVSVLDPERFWVPPEPECRHPRSVGRDPVAGRGVASMEQAVREGLAGVLPSDVVRRAGYASVTEDSSLVIVIRDGRAVASVNVHRADGLYFFFGGAVCPGYGISLP